MGQKLGQHFLTNKQQLKKISDSLELKKGDFVIEIGPGHGELTEFLLESDVKLAVVEKDENLADYLAGKFGDTISIIKGDALAELPNLIKKKKLKNQSYKIAGNIPYYITGYLFRIIGELKNKPSVVVFTIQKEVAQRICAKKGDMNILAASIQIWAEPKIISTIPKGDFSPPPKIDSAIIKLTVKPLLHPPLTKGRKEVGVIEKRSDIPSSSPLKGRKEEGLETLSFPRRGKGEVNIQKYYKTVKAVFKQPRKTVFNNLVAALGKENKDKIEEVLKYLGINPSLRPQYLDVKDIISLTELF